jgi:Putative transmembrane protein (Alph_Pro_TM)
MSLVDSSAVHLMAAPACPRRRTVRGLLGLKVILFFIVFSLSDPALLVADERSVSLRLTPEQVQMGTFYNGSKMRMEGTAPAGSQVLAVIRGADKPEVFNRKGRVGPIWLNTDKVRITQVPALFLSYGSAEVRSVLDGAVVDEYQLDETAIQKRMLCLIHWKCPPGKDVQANSDGECSGVQPEARDGQVLRASFIKLKTNQGIYQIEPRTVQVADAGNGEARYTLDLLWPRKAPPGTYQVDVYAIRDHAIIARASTRLEVVEVGFPAFMANLATSRPWFYGVLAVVAAVIAGFGIDAIAVRLRKTGARPRPARAPLPEPQPAEPEPAVRAQASEEKEHVHH